jgi:hypothetical protein
MSAQSCGLSSDILEAVVTLDSQKEMMIARKVKKAEIGTQKGTRV